ncbi:MAG: hypothetical protein C5B52_11335 [Bacteroidetes bacterium]|nr:MAG: hypothetical protein C5B52_11335 [Bacteroidota bacterium]
MNAPFSDINEKEAESAFTKQAPVFDNIYGTNTIIRYKRERVRNHVNQYLQTQSQILELNAGTGEDAIYFAENGHHVHATDISQGMQDILRKKIKGLENNISQEICSYTRLDSLEARGPYDLIFSNFAGLNCTNELGKVISGFDKLLKPGGFVTLVILPKFCLWETMLLFRGKFKTAFRRFFSKHGTSAHIEGQYFRCWYYDPSEIKKLMGPAYEMVSIEGLCSLVPPSYIENFAEKHSRLFGYLVKKESRLKSKWPWKSIGDYYIISFQKK